MRKLGVDNIVAKRKTFWGENIHMIVPHPRSLYFFGCLGKHEIALTHFLINTLRPGDVLVDGGSNIGYYSLLAANLVGENGTVHSFEPTPEIIPILKRNLEAKNNVHINATALWDKKDNVALFKFPIKHSVFNTLIDITHLRQSAIPGLELDLVEKGKVQTVDLDSYCKENDLKPTFIKLDIERAEYRALQGGREIITSCRPIIALENWSDTTGDTSFKKILSLFTGLHYKICTIAPDFTLVPVSNEEEVIGINVICLP